jgi:mannose-6-phosphate isomerase-like protein (cupin superfamily)
MRPILAKSWEADFLATPPPYERRRQVLLSGKIHGLSSAAIGTVTIPPGSRGDYHSHEKSDEFWIFTNGHGRINVDGNEAEIEPGIVVCVPAKAKHQIINDGKETVHAYWVLSPPGPEEALLDMMEKT